jgi:hypothetical protein
LARAVPCRLHAIGELEPNPKDPADQFAGGCHECGRPILYNVERSTPREREVIAELFGVGSSLATLTASRRSWAAILWLRQQGKKRTQADTGLLLALHEENQRRLTEMWAAHLRTVSDEMLNLLGAEEFREATAAELEAIIWPADII